MLGFGFLTFKPPLGIRPHSRFLWLSYALSIKESTAVSPGGLLFMVFSFDLTARFLLSMTASSVGRR